mmetsp:Transcript_16485/g.13510  ORF Transcript_16485/g.13510 Transcript_16485/m.13510 type:complete len:245 (-) Transcript_16485:642-1376(-)
MKKKTATAHRLLSWVRCGQHLESLSFFLSFFLHHKLKAVGRLWRERKTHFHRNVLECHQIFTHAIVHHGFGKARAETQIHERGNEGHDSSRHVHRVKVENHRNEGVPFTLAVGCQVNTRCVVVPAAQEYERRRVRAAVCVLVQHLLRGSTSNSPKADEQQDDGNNEHVHAQIGPWRRREGLEHGHCNDDGTQKRHQRADDKHVTVRSLVHNARLQKLVRCNFDVLLCPFLASGELDARVDGLEE